MHDRISKWKNGIIRPFSLGEYELVRGFVLLHLLLRESLLDKLHNE